MKLWDAYVWKKQTLSQLAEAAGRSHVWVRKQLDRATSALQPVSSQPAVVITDTTFWGRSYGVCVFRAPSLKRNLWWHEVDGEKVAHYHYGRKILESRGWTFTAAVVDGRRGLASVFKDIPVQICQFHQVKQVTKYLTRKPETEAGRRLRTLALTLKDSDERTFSKQLAAWHKQWSSFINQKTRLRGCNRWHYTHKNVRSAYKSLERNLTYLFTYQKYPHLCIPNTTNSLDGSFSQLKARLAVHRGLRRDRRYKIISEILGGEKN